MNYHYLHIYHDFGKPEDTKWVKQSLLHDFSNEEGFLNCKKASIELKDYSFQEYPDQEELKAYLRKSYLNKKDRCYYWCGKAYYSYEELYNALSEQKRLLALEAEVTE